MAREVHIEPSRTYATRANAIKAVDKIFEPTEKNLRYILVCNEVGRWYPIFVGTPAMQAGVHFHFCVVS